MTTERPTDNPSPTHPGPAPGGDGLDALRAKIDEIDRRLVAMLNERAQVVVEVGKVKRSTGAPIYAPHREAAVLDRALQANQGPLPPRTIEAVFRELMSGSFALERPLRIGYLGPAGSFSHEAAVKHFGSSVSLEDLRDIAGVFHEVRRGHADYGLAPIENSTMGGIVETLDAFVESRGEAIVYAEALLNVHHALLASCEPHEIRRVHSKPEVFAQCRKWLGAQLPEAELIPAPSTSRAAITAREEIEGALGRGERPSSAAIGSILAGQLAGLDAVFEKIEDNPNNITRFFVISREQARPTGDDKTSVMFRTADTPGALVEVLSAFQRAGVNLTHIDKRPSGRDNWAYTFFVDAQGHRDDAKVAGALEDARRHCLELIVLGSYPRATRIL